MGCDKRRWLNHPKALQVRARPLLCLFVYIKLTDSSPRQLLRQRVFLFRCFRYQWMFFPPSFALCLFNHWCGRVSWGSTSKWCAFNFPCGKQSLLTDSRSPSCTRREQHTVESYHGTPSIETKNETKQVPLCRGGCSHMQFELSGPRKNKHCLHDRSVSSLRIKENAEPVREEKS